MNASNSYRWTGTVSGGRYVSSHAAATGARGLTELSGYQALRLDSETVTMKKMLSDMKNKLEVRPNLIVWPPSVVSPDPATSRNL